jgi:hypothetical protein
MKVVYLVVGVMLLTLGLIGLVIPVIPGILFLIAAVFVLGKVSRRVRRWGQSNDTYRSVSGRFERMSHVGVMDRVKVTVLMLAGSIARSVDVAVSSARQLFRRVVR